MSMRRCCFADLSQTDPTDQYARASLSATVKGLLGRCVPGVPDGRLVYAHIRLPTHAHYSELLCPL
mgnify:CR=1 FL=1